MTLKTKIVAACAAAAMVITMAAANAQMNGATPMISAPPMSAPPMMPMSGSMTTSQTTQSSTTTSPDYAADAAYSDAGTLPNTGGEPLLLMMAGSLIASGAFAMRRKLS